MPIHPGRLACTLALACAAQGAFATVAPLAADGRWHGFNVDSLVAASSDTGWIDTDDHSPLSFAFTIGPGFVGRLTVVDLGFAGDRFVLNDAGRALGATSAVPVLTVGAAPLEMDPDAALADAAFSRAVLRLGAGAYLVSGALAQSVLLDDGTTPLEATAGALRLQLAAVPEPASLGLLLTALLTLAAVHGRDKR